MTNLKKYIVEDDAGTDIFRDLYNTPAEAIKAARADWEHLTASEQRSRRITVQEIVPEGIFADVLDPEELNEDGTPNLALDSVWLAASEAAKILWDSSKPETAEDAMELIRTQPYRFWSDFSDPQDIVRKYGDDEDLAETFRHMGEWEPDMCAELIHRAARIQPEIEAEYDAADGDNVEDVLYRAAEILGVEII